MLGSGDEGSTATCKQCKDIIQVHPLRHVQSMSSSLHPGRYIQKCMVVPAYFASYGTWGRNADEFVAGGRYSTALWTHAGHCCTTTPQDTKCSVHKCRQWTCCMWAYSPWNLSCWGDLCQEPVGGTRCTYLAIESWSDLCATYVILQVAGNFSFQLMCKPDKYK